MARNIAIKYVNRYASCCFSTQGLIEELQFVVTEVTGACESANMARAARGICPALYVNRTILKLFFLTLVLSGDPELKNRQRGKTFQEALKYLMKQSRVEPLRTDSLVLQERLFSRMDTYGLAINDDLGELRRKMSGEDPHVGSLIPDFEYFDHYQRIMPDANPKDNANVLICNAAASYTFFDLSEVVRLEPDVVIPDGYTEETLLIDPFLSVLVRELISNVWVAQFETYRALRAIPEFAALREL